MIVVRRFSLAAPLALVLASAILPAVSGCGAGAANDGSMLKDPPPLAKEETTEEWMKQQAKANPKLKSRLPRR